MKLLSWDGARGVAQNGGASLTLSAAPALGFAFDTLKYSDTVAGTKSIAGQAVALSSAEVSAVTAYLAPLAASSSTSFVWGVTSTGALLGLVPKAQAFFVTRAQPSPASAYRYDFPTGLWVDTRAKPADTGAQALATAQAGVTANTAAIATLQSSMTAAFAALPAPVPLATVTPSPEASTAAIGATVAAARADHVHQRLSCAQYVTLDASGLATCTFTTPFDFQPVVKPDAVVPAGGLPVICLVQSFVVVNGKYTGVVVKGYRQVLLPTLALASLLTAVITALSNFSVFSASGASGVSVSILAIKVSS